MDTLSIVSQQSGRSREGASSAASHGNPSLNSQTTLEDTWKPQGSLPSYSQVYRGYLETTGWPPILFPGIYRILGNHRVASHPVPRYIEDTWKPQGGLFFKSIFLSTYSCMTTL